MQKKADSFAVLGAGNGGQAMAAFLSLKGYKVNLYNRSQKRIEEVKKAGGINLKGEYSGFGKLHIITTSIEEAIQDVEVIMVVTPAVAHRYLARTVSPYLQDGQIVILNPGRTGGALEFDNTLRQNGCQSEAIVAEAQTFLFASRVTGPAQAKIFGEKNKVAIAAFPSLQTRRVIDTIEQAFPHFTPVENVLKTSLDNIGAVFHPAPTLLNMAWIESTGGSFNYYQEGISVSVARILEKIDQERLDVATELGVEPTNASDWLRLSYGARGRNLYELLQNNKQYFGISAPADLNSRYIFEDVPMSLVPISSLGTKLKVPTPTIDMIINLANIVHATDYREVGRTVENLGLNDLKTSEIINLVNIGQTERKPVVSEQVNNRIEGIFFNNYDSRGGLER